MSVHRDTGRQSLRITGRCKAITRSSPNRNAGEIIWVIRQKLTGATRAGIPLRVACMGVSIVMPGELRKDLRVVVTVFPQIIMKTENTQS